MKKFLSVPIVAFALTACADQARIIAPEAPAGPALTTAPLETYESIALGGDNSVAIELNDHGIVVGALNNVAAYWKVNEAGDVAGPFHLGSAGPRSSATAINNQGQIIVRGYGQGFLYNVGTGTLTRLSEPEGATYSAPWSINEAGIVAGAAGIDGGQRGVVWFEPQNPDVSPAVLPRIEGEVESFFRFFVNDQNVVIGYSKAADGAWTRVRWTVNAADRTISTPVAVATGDFEPLGFRMNDAEQLAGVLPGRNAAVQQSGGSILRLDPLAGDATAAARSPNDPAEGRLAQVPGVSGFGTDAEKAIVWTLGADGTASAPVQLPSGKSETSRPFAINANGWVAGEATNTRRGTKTAVLWRPKPSGGSCVPKGNGGNCK